MDKKKIKVLIALIGMVALVVLILWLFVIPHNNNESIDTSSESTQGTDQTITDKNDPEIWDSDGNLIPQEGPDENDPTYQSSIVAPYDKFSDNSKVFTVYSRSGEKFTFGGETTNTENRQYSMINLAPKHYDSTAAYGYYVTTNAGMLYTNIHHPYTFNTEGYLSSPDEAPDVKDFYLIWPKDVLRPASEITWGTGMISGLDIEVKDAGGVHISVRVVNLYTDKCEGIFHITIEKNSDGKYAIKSVEDGTIPYDTANPDAEINLVYKALEKKVRETDNAIRLKEDFSVAEFNITEESFSNYDNIFVEQFDDFYFPYTTTGGHWGVGTYDTEPRYQYDKFIPISDVLSRHFADHIWAVTVNSPEQHSYMTYYFIPTQNSQVIAIEGPSMICVAQDLFRIPPWEILNADIQQQKATEKELQDMFKDIP